MGATIARPAIDAIHPERSFVMNQAKPSLPVQPAPASTPQPKDLKPKADAKGGTHLLLPAWVDHRPGRG
jgi:hypothetical protein